MPDVRETFQRGWDTGYQKAMLDVHAILDELGAPREANGAKLYIAERIAALRPSGVLGTFNDQAKDTK